MKHSTTRTNADRASKKKYNTGRKPLNPKALTVAQLRNLSPEALSEYIEKRVKESLSDRSPREAPNNLR